MMKPKSMMINLVRQRLLIDKRLDISHSVKEKYVSVHNISSTFWFIDIQVYPDT